jgi:hypothetical protein
MMLNIPPCGKSSATRMNNRYFNNGKQISRLQKCQSNIERASASAKVALGNNCGVNSPNQSDVFYAPHVIMLTKVPSIKLSVALDSCCGHGARID